MPCTSTFWHPVTLKQEKSICAVKRITHKSLLKEIRIMRIILPTTLSRKPIIPIILISFNKKAFSFLCKRSQMPRCRRDGHAPPAHPVTLQSPLTASEKDANTLYIGVLAPCHPLTRKIHLSLWMNVTL